MTRKRRKRNRRRENDNQKPGMHGIAPAPAPGHGQNVYVNRLEQEIFWDEEEKPGRGTEILDEVVIKALGVPGVTTADFVDAGFSCTECDWRTKKKGLNGVQARRGHSKKHVNDKRTTRNSRLLHVVVLAIALFVALSPGLVRNSSLATWLELLLWTS